MRNRENRPFERVFLHVGLPKTGTTSIQECLFANRSALESAGYLVPQFEKSGETTFTTNASLFLNALHGQGLNTDAQRSRNERNLSSFHTEIQGRRSHVTSLVLSGEAISMWSETELRGFWEWGYAAQLWNEQTEFKMLYVARNFVEWFRKIAEQRLLNAPMVDDLMQLRVHMRNQVLTFKSSAEAVFGEECMAFGSFENWCASEGGLLKRFSEWLGAPLPQRDFAANPSRSYEVLRLLRALGPEWPNRSIFANQLRHVPGLNPAWSEKMGQEMAFFWQSVAEQWTAQTGCNVQATPEGVLELSKPDLWSPMFLESLEQVVLQYLRWRNRCDELRGAFERIIQEEGSQWATESLARVQDFLRRLEANS